MTSSSEGPGGPRRRLRTLAPLLSLAFLAGCLDGGGGSCPDLEGRGVVEQVGGAGGRDVSVRLPDGEPAVLHLPASLHLLEGGRCRTAAPSEVAVGDALSFEVEAWAESYPVQGWPEEVVVLR